MGNEHEWYGILFALGEGRKRWPKSFLAKTVPLAKLSRQTWVQRFSTVPDTSFLSSVPKLWCRVQLKPRAIFEIDSEKKAKNGCVGVRLHSPLHRKSSNRIATLLIHLVPESEKKRHLGSEWVRLDRHSLPYQRLVHYEQEFIFSRPRSTEHFNTKKLAQMTFLIVLSHIAKLNLEFDAHRKTADEHASVIWSRRETAVPTFPPFSAALSWRWRYSSCEASVLNAVRASSRCFMIS